MDESKQKQSVLELLSEGGGYFKYVRLSDDKIRITSCLHIDHSRMVNTGETAKSAGYCVIRKIKNSTGFRGCCQEESMTLELWPAEGDMDLIFKYLGVEGMEDSYPL